MIKMDHKEKQKQIVKESVERRNRWEQKRRAWKDLLIFMEEIEKKDEMICPCCKNNIIRKDKLVKDIERITKDVDSLNEYIRGLNIGLM